MLIIQDRLRCELLRLAREMAEIDAEEIPITVPSQAGYGELSSTLPFVLAKKTGQKPYVLGMRLKEGISGRLSFIRDVQLMNGGFLNFFFQEGFWLRYLMHESQESGAWIQDKIIVEHTSINPNKAAHIGHLRNACLGDTLARAYRYLGAKVEVQNYIDDTGIQVADVVWGLTSLDGKDLNAIRDIVDLPRYLWEAYPRYSRTLSEDEVKKAQRNQTHKQIEERIEPDYRISLYVAETVLRDHLEVMGHLGIDYDLLVREQDIMAMDFFSQTADILRQNGILYPSKDPEKAGCEVIYYETEKLEKIVIRSNGTVTYIGKDLAYTFWKLGLSGKDFLYKQFERNYGANQHNPHLQPQGTTISPPKTIWISDDLKGPTAEGFGHGNREFNVIDVRQSYLQAIIGQVVGRLYHGEKDRFAHFSYEMVALTPRCVEELGFPLSDEDYRKPYIEVSGRRGIAVEAADLMHRMSTRSLREVEARNPDLDSLEHQKIADQIAVGALRYFMLRYTSNSVIAFDFDEALAFEGDTGPYLQYTMTRIANIFRRQGVDPLKERSDSGNYALLGSDEREVVEPLLIAAAQVPEQVLLALQQHELSVIAHFTYSLAQQLNHYYHRFSVQNEPDEQLKQLRISLLAVVFRRLGDLLEILGIPVPERM